MPGGAANRPPPAWQDNLRFAPAPTSTLGAGAGLKPEHCQQIISERPNVGFFEVHAENYMGDGGAPHAWLGRIRAAYPVSLHGVGLSIGGEAPLDREHLRRLAALNRRYQPELFSEHLAWSTHDNTYYNDLLPIPYDESTLKRVVDHVDQVQSSVGRRMLLENPATYLEFAGSTMTEVDFLEQVVRRTGCGLLLDVSNVVISCVNHGRDPADYLDAFPLEHVGELHVSGYTPAAGDETLLIDTHGAHVPEAVWVHCGRLLERRLEPLPILIEWDNNVPAWEELFADVRRAGELAAAGILHTGACPRARTS